MGALHSTDGGGKGCINRSKAEESEAVFAPLLIEVVHLRYEKYRGQVAFGCMPCPASVVGILP